MSTLLQANILASLEYLGRDMGTEEGHGKWGKNKGSYRQECRVVLAFCWRLWSPELDCQDFVGALWKVSRNRHLGDKGGKVSPSASVSRWSRVALRVCTTLFSQMCLCECHAGPPGQPGAGSQRTGVLSDGRCYHHRWPEVVRACTQLSDTVAGGSRGRENLQRYTEGRQMWTGWTHGPRFTNRRLNGDQTPRLARGFASTPRSRSLLTK